jgi:hypothetical protein
MKLLKIVKSDRQGKKWKAVFDNDGRSKTTHFGDSTAQDYTQHGDKERRERYRTRHQKDLATKDPSKAGFLSYYILWGESTSIHQNIASYKTRFNL